MDRRRVFYLRIAVILLFMLSILPVTVALNREVETMREGEIGEADFISVYNETEQMEQPAVGGTNKGIEIANSIIEVLESNPEDLKRMKTALVSLNETVEQFNSGIEFTNGMLVDNLTSGESLMSFA